MSTNVDLEINLTLYFLIYRLRNSISLRKWKLLEFMHNKKTRIYLVTMQDTGQK